MIHTCSGRPRPLHRSLLNPPQARQWGANWGKTKRSTKPKQQQNTQQTVIQPSTATLSLQSACSKLSQAITSEFLATGIPSQGGVCVTACAVLMDAIEILDVEADVQPEMCYLHVRQPDGTEAYPRHMVVKVDGQTYDIGGDISQASGAMLNLEASSTEIVYSLPGGANSLGWRTGDVTPDGAQSMAEAPSELEELTLQKLRSASAREILFEKTPPELQQARQQVLAVARSLKGTVSRP